jgi:hypothetical protein
MEKANFEQYGADWKGILLTGMEISYPLEIQRLTGRK